MVREKTDTKWSCGPTSKLIRQEKKNPKLKETKQNLTSMHRVFHPSGNNHLCYFPLVALSLSCVQHFATPRTAVRRASLSSTISRSLLKLMTIELMMPSNHLTLRHPLLLLPSIFPSIRVFSSESALCIKWPKYWSFGFSISRSKEYSGLISFRADPVGETQTLPHSSLPGDRAQ